MNVRRLIAATLTLLACSASRADLPPPNNWPAPAYAFENNPRTAAGFELGRQLFYDPLLSRDGTISCASCHQQAAAFAHARHRVSHGIGGQLGKRNAPALFNLAWDKTFMWDGSIPHLEFQPLAPIANPIEMDQNVAGLVDKLKTDPGYPKRFEAAFGSPGIDTPRVLRALAQFTGALVSSDSHYDRVVTGRERYTALETRGHAVFAQRCAGCHAEPLFTDGSYRNNGLDAAPADPGRSGISNAPADNGRFRVPSLRNIGFTAPYMHDGRFETLEQVLDHYDHGVQASPTLDPLLAKSAPLSAEDRAGLLAFLNALDDATFVHDARFAEPRPPQGAPPLRQVATSDGGCGSDSFFAFLLPANLCAHGLEARPATVAITNERFELVASRHEDTLMVYVDDFATNAPVDGLDLTVRAGTTILRAAPRGDGAYEVPGDHVVDGSPIVFRLRTATGGEVELSGTLKTP